MIEVTNQTQNQEEENQNQNQITTREMAVRMWEYYAERIAPNEEWVRKSIKHLLRLHNELSQWLFAYSVLADTLRAELNDDILLNELETAKQRIEYMKKTIEKHIKDAKDTIEEIEKANTVN